MNPLKKLQDYGQSIWLDYIKRSFVMGGELQKLIDDDGLRGVTSNPDIFDKAIADSDDYDDAIAKLCPKTVDVAEIYEALAVEDVQMAVDKFRPVYDKLDGRDGFVSLEVSPHLAHDADASIESARKLWSLLDRPNVFIKIPATKEGLPAIQRCIAEGININVTLLFGLPRYRAVAEAYIAGIESRVEQGKSVERVASVASFFLSRIDTLVDEKLEKISPLRGQTAIASAKVAYQIYKDLFGDERFRRLRERGARPQRLLWASTSTKNPEYSDVKYVEPLIGPDTINTLPPKTLDAYRDHGEPKPRLEEGLTEARMALGDLPKAGIDIEEVTQQLEDEGVEKFIKPFDSLMNSLGKACEKARQKKAA